MIQGMAGAMSITGEADGLPQKAGYATADIFTGMYTSVAILAALRQRDATGAGATIDWRSSRRRQRCSATRR